MRGGRRGRLQLAERDPPDRFVHRAVLIQVAPVEDQLVRAPGRKHRDGRQVRRARAFTRACSGQGEVWLKRARFGSKSCGSALGFHPGGESRQRMRGSSNSFTINHMPVAASLQPIQKYTLGEQAAR